MKTVQVCAASRELRFFVNGVDQGVAFRDLPLGTPLYGAVSLYNKDSQIVYNVRISVGLHSYRHIHASRIVHTLSVGTCGRVWRAHGGHRMSTKANKFQSATTRSPKQPRRGDMALQLSLTQ